MTPRGRFDRVLVTGAAGFIGACAVRALIARGAEVHAVVRPGSNLWRLAGLDTDAVLHRVDLAEHGSVNRLVDEVQPHAVVHLAAHGAYERQDDFPAMVRCNVLATHNLLEASLASGVTAFVNAGSSSEYGFRRSPMRETDRLEPNSHYAISKAAQTHLCSLLGNRAGIEMGVATFRLFSVYGPWEEPSRLIPTLIGRARAGLPLEMAAPTTARDFVYVGDVIEALLDFQQTARLRGDVINLGTGVETPLHAVVNLVRELTGSRSEVRWGVMPARRWDTDRWVANPSHAHELIGWRARHDLRQGLIETMNWFTEVADGADTGAGLRRSAG